MLSFNKLGSVYGPRRHKLEVINCCGDLETSPVPKGVILGATATVLNGTNHSNIHRAHFGDFELFDRPFYEDEVLEDGRDVDEFEEDTELSSEDCTFRHGEEFDLKKIFPLSPLLVLEKTWHYLVFCTLTVAIFVGRNGWEELFHPHHWVEEFELLIVRIKFFLWTASALYWECIRRGTEMKLDGHRLEMAQGVWWKTRATMQLLPHTTIYVERHGWFDLLFNTATLKICPVNMPDSALVTIQCMPTDRAHRMKRYLTQQIDRQLGIDLNRAEQYQ